ncbi:MAG: hypothetical protein LRY51_00910 [Geovibrio sp.]|nr:hypothetical protein [Geovibrio sp.]
MSELGVQVSEADRVELDGKPVTETELEYYRFFKPRGMLTAYGDGRGRKLWKPYLI